MRSVAWLAGVLLLTLAFAREALAVSAIPRLSAETLTSWPLVHVQQSDVPDVVRLLAQRAVRAERRGDMVTANALYAVIREMGYSVRRPGGQAPRSGSGSTSGNRGGGLFGGGGFFGSADRDDDDSDDDDAGWDGNDGGWSGGDDGGSGGDEGGWGGDSDSDGDAGGEGGGDGDGGGDADGDGGDD